MNHTRTSRWFDCLFKFTGWHCLSLGLHVDLIGPLVEIHLPFGFLRIGLLYWRRDGERTWSPGGSNWRSAASLAAYDHVTTGRPLDFLFRDRRR